MTKLVEIRDLNIRFSGERTVHAVNDLSLSLGEGEVLGRDVLALDDEELSAFRGQTVSMIFQEPALALDPVYTIGRQIAESVMRHEGKSQSDANARALEMLEVVRSEERRVGKECR